MILAIALRFFVAGYNCKIADNCVRMPWVKTTDKGVENDDTYTYFYISIITKSSK